MTADAMVGEIVQCFVPPPRPMVEKMKSLAEGIPESARQSVIDRITETEGPSSKVGVKQMVEACDALGVGYRQSRYTPAQDWICDACGHQFKYSRCPSDDEKIDLGLHDCCPMCGFQATWTEVRDAYRTMGGLSPAYTAQYAAQVEACTSKHGPKAPGGIYWSRSRAESERRDDRRVRIDRQMEDLGHSKGVS